MTEVETKHSVETKADESSRMWASAAFVGVLIIIGLPLWWKTTEVYRVTLPYEEIAAFSPESHVVTTELTVLADDEKTASEVAAAIRQSFEKSDVIRVIVHQQVLSDALHHTLSSVADDAEALEAVASTFDLSQHNHLYVVQRRPLFEKVWVSTERVVFFRDGRAAAALSSVLESWMYHTGVLRGAGAGRGAGAARRTRFPAAVGLHVVLSVLQPRPDLLTVERQLVEQLEDYIGAFVDELSVLHNFTLKSQWLHLLEFDFKEKETSSPSLGRHFAVRRDRLHLLLTRIEERAATRAASQPAVNLAVYAQPCARAPLVAYDDNNTPIPTVNGAITFMSPKWGAVYIGSPTREECAAGGAVWRPRARELAGSLLPALRQLLGIVDTEPLEGAFLAPLRSAAPRAWEVDNLLRIRTLEQVSSAELTLQSLAQLLGEISNIVINDEVGASIKTAVEDIEIASTLLSRGALVEAYKASLEAYQAAEAAFTDPSLLALLYFPDDQKYAIYIPLFLPIMFPVLLSVKNLMQWLRGTPAKQKTD